MTTLIAKTITKACVPIIILFSISLLLAGHNYPGGGFIGGVMFTSAISLLYIVFGLRYMDSLYRYQWEKWFAVGLLISTLTGIGAMAFRYSFLRSTYLTVSLPLLGDIKLLSTTFFDIGVYLVVTGSLLFVFKTMGEDE
ncbi:MnhB domain-containing protein [Methanolobus chelungpuianus]|uniref:Monovalent cation/H+ antiporter subunit B n=1 Tax=Methanolobus chelungpuianus TaxID=502115 RepID=A0AAE3KXU6_9EURY|nr:monovalent cation/H+ antiporter subunit B [Methanolobus chelungpuianus]